MQRNEHEQLWDSDSDPTSHSSQETFVGDDKRQYHNVLEQKRRNILKTNFDRLMEVIPSLKKKGFVINDKKVSRAKILKAAIHCIKRAERKKPALLRDIKNLEKHNASLEQYQVQLQNALRTGDHSKMESIFRNIDEVNGQVYDEDSTESEDENEDIDDAESDPDNEEEEDQEIDYSSENGNADASVNVSEESEDSDSDDSSEYSSSDDE